MRRESTLIQRTLFVYIFKAVQVSMPCALAYFAPLSHSSLWCMSIVACSLGWTGVCIVQHNLGLHQHLHALCTTT